MAEPTPQIQPRVVLVNPGLKGPERVQAFKRAIQRLVLDVARDLEKASPTPSTPESTPPSKAPPTSSTN